MEKPYFYVPSTVNEVIKDKIKRNWEFRGFLEKKKESKYYLKFITDSNIVNIVEVKAYK